MEARRITVYEQNVERATQGRAVGTRRGGPADVVARPHVRRRRSTALPSPRHRADRPASTPDRSRGDPMNENASPPSDADLSRRQFLQGSALAGFARLPRRLRDERHAAAPSAAASAAAPSAGRLGQPRARRPRRPRSRRPSAELNFANWPLYIDTDDERHDQAQDARGLQGEVRDDRQLPEVIDDNDEFFGHDPAAARGRPGHGLGPRSC